MDNKLRTFQHIYEPFIQPDFCKLIERFVSLKYINGVPTFNGNRTFFWSDVKFDKIKQQYLINSMATKPAKYLFTKNPVSYEESFASYSLKFNQQLNQARKNNLIAEMFFGLDIDKNLIDDYYKIYTNNMHRLHSVSFPKEFFHGLFELPYTTIFSVKKENKVISFSICLGNYMFIQSSNEQGRILRANNFLYDTIYKTFAGKTFFLGTSYANSGLYRFKLNSGAQPSIVGSIKPDLVLHILNHPVMRNNKLLVKTMFMLKTLLLDKFFLWDIVFDEVKEMKNKEVFKRLFPY